VTPTWIGRSSRRAPPLRRSFRRRRCVPPSPARRATTHGHGRPLRWHEPQCLCLRVFSSSLSLSLSRSLALFSLTHHYHSHTHTPLPLSHLSLSHTTRSLSPLALSHLSLSLSAGEREGGGEDEDVQHGRHEEAHQGGSRKMGHLGLVRARHRPPSHTLSRPTTTPGPRWDNPTTTPGPRWDHLGWDWSQTMIDPHHPRSLL
jgi:hypothetical protein